MANSEVPAQTEAEKLKKELDLFKSDREKYNGVGGWLLLLCIGLVIVQPLYTLYSFFIVFFASHVSSAIMSAYEEAYHKIFIVDSAVTTSLLAYGMYVGIRLWSVKSNAIHRTKQFLRVYLVISFLRAGLPFLVSLPSSVAVIFAGTYLTHVIGASFYVGVWYLYLKRSRRVRITFGL